MSRTNCIEFLDIAFREDDCRVRKDYRPGNLAVLRHINLNLIKQMEKIQTRHQG